MSRVPVSVEELLADPLAAWARVRQVGPVMETPNGAAVVTHDGVRELLADARMRTNVVEFLHAFGVVSGPFHDWMAGSPLNRDGADHLRWRSLVSRTFTPRRVDRIRPFLREAAHELIDGFAARGTCDFVPEFADPYPSLGLCELIGVPKEDRDRFRGWANTIGLGFNFMMLAANIDAVDAALVQLLDYTRALAAARRTDPRDDLVTRIAQAARDEGWTDDEVHGTIAGLVFAGHETTKNQLGWMAAVLADRPAVWDAVATGEVEPARVVDEVLRYRSAATGVGRTVGEAVSVGGERLEPGERVFLSLWSANHDAAAYPAPETVDLQANGDVPHLAFGHGAHFCLGAALARAELQEALVALTARLSPPRLGDDATWAMPFGITGPTSLPLRFTARPRPAAAQDA